MSVVTSKHQLLKDRYKIMSELGQGSMGQTYLAKDLQRPDAPDCVVKKLKPASNEPEFLEVARRLFISEAEILEKLGRAQDQIPQLLAHFENDGEFYLVQDYVDGHPLTEELPQNLRWPEADVIQLLREVLELLKQVHHEGVIHRDVKPDNLIRRSDNKLCLIDFGAVKQMRMLQTAKPQSVSMTVGIGTPGYMPSEQSNGKPMPSSDLYALGMVAIQALTGMSPSQLQDDDEGEIIWRKYANVSDGLAIFLSKMVRYHFKERYRTSASALLDLHRIALQNLVGQEPIEIDIPTSEAKTEMLAGTQAVAPERDSTTQVNSQTKAQTVVAAPQQAQPATDQTAVKISWRKRPWMIGTGVLLAIVGTWGAVSIHNRSQQEQAVERVEQLLTSKQFDQCMDRSNGISGMPNDLHSKLSSITQNCRTGKAQKTKLDQIKENYRNQKYREAIKAAKEFSDERSPFYSDVQKVLAESQLTLAEQLLNQGKYKDGIDLLSAIPSSAANYDKVKELKSQWSEKMFTVAEQLYQEGRNSREVEKAIQILQAIPQDSQFYPKVQTKTQQWREHEAKNSSHRAQAKSALDKGDWETAKQHANALINSDSQAWRGAGRRLLAKVEKGIKREGEPINAKGKLALGEPGVKIRADHNILFKDYEFQGKTGDEITISLRGNFDTKLYLISPDRQQILLNDDASPNNRNSNLMTKLRQTGTYKVRVSAYHRANDFQQRGQGRYRVVAYRERPQD